MKAQTAVLQIAWSLSNHFLIRGAAERWGGGGVLSFPASSSPPPAWASKVTQDNRRIFSYNWKAHIFQYYFQYSWRQHRIYSVEWDSRSLKWQEALSSTFPSFCWQVTFFQKSGLASSRLATWIYLDVLLLVQWKFSLLLYEAGLEPWTCFILMAIYFLAYKETSREPPPHTHTYKHTMKTQYKGQHWNFSNLHTQFFFLKKCM